jgi:hypothetical protein
MSPQSGDRSNKSASRVKRSRLPEILSRRVTTYVIAASAAGVTATAMVASAETPQGPIVYTPANVSLSGLGMTHFNVDLNHDGIADFRLEMTNTRWVSSGGGGDGGHASFWDLPYGGNGAMPRPLPKGALIGTSGGFNGNDRLAWGRSANHSGHGGYYTGGPWAQSDAEKYLGVRFLIDGETHYGWVRMSVFTEPSNIGATITGFAYNTVANQPLKAGEGAQKPNRASLHPASLPPATFRPASLGALSLGAAGIALWRKNEPQN